jgi:hypothetical protein
MGFDGAAIYEGVRRRGHGRAGAQLHGEWESERRCSVETTTGGAAVWVNGRWEMTPGTGWAVPGVAGPERNRAGTVIKSKKK